MNSKRIVREIDELNTSLKHFGKRFPIVFYGTFILYSILTIISKTLWNNLDYWVAWYYDQFVLDVFIYWTFICSIWGFRIHIDQAKEERRLKNETS